MAQIDDKRLLVFGGLNKRVRYNDVWLLNHEEKTWTAVEVGGTAPEPRAHFTATRFGNRVFIYGGYGGSGQVYNEMWVLHVGEDSFRWENVTESLQGTGPSARFDHSAFIYPVVPNSETYDKLLIMGGRDLSQMYQDSHMLDLNRMAWENDTQPPSLPYEICNNVCDGIESVPYHKVFSFGGRKGMMQYLNTVDVMDCGSQMWSTPQVDHGTPPVGREDTAWVFDVKTCSLLIFGGWANRWLGDLHKLNVSPIIGPPYACTGISPEMGPVFGSTDIIIRGLRFREGRVQVKFGLSEKNEVIVEGTYVDPETIRVQTPNYEQYGALGVDVRVSINGEGWTVNKIKFGYFANTAARNCIAYGPGLLAETLSSVEVPFIVQAKDTLNDKRSSGGDIFKVTVQSADGKQAGISRVRDLNNGQYEVQYFAPTAGKYIIHVSFNELGTSDFVSIRGSPFTVRCLDPWVRPRIMGTAPSKRKGVTLSTLGQELVLYGGDRSGVTVLNTEHAEWRWTPTSTSGATPPDRTLHSTVVLSDCELVVFGGIGLMDQNDLNDVFYLRKQTEGWVWSTPAENRPYMRCVGNRACRGGRQEGGGPVDGPASKLEA